MAEKKKSRSVKDAVCSGCIGLFKFKELNQVILTMHMDSKDDNNCYGVYVCDKCEPKFRLDRRQPTL